ncbi:MAG: pentapeptide repeat-containing protein, partial [Gammaproteobacteria bacterium]
MLLSAFYGRLSLAACNDIAAPGVNWAGCNKTGVILRNVDLTGAILRAVDLSNADLSGARLVHAEMNFADLTNTRFDGALMQSAR